MRTVITLWFLLFASFSAFAQDGWSFNTTIFQVGSKDSLTRNESTTSGHRFINSGRSYETGFGWIVTHNWQKSFPLMSISPNSKTSVEVTVKGGLFDSVGILITLDSSRNKFEMPLYLYVVSKMDSIHLVEFTTRGEIGGFDIVYLSFITWAPGGQGGVETRSDLLLRNLQLADSTGVITVLDFSPTTEVGQGGEVPAVVGLHQNYPNPFNPSTTIKFDVPRQGNVNLKILNLIGQEVATLVDEVKVPGSYEAVFDASRLPSGIYFYRLKAGELVKVRRMILLK